MKRIVVAIILVFILINGIYASIPYPVIFVHGTGDSSVAWKETGPVVSKYYEKYYKTANHPHFISGSGIGKDRFDKEYSDNIRNSCIYITFSDHYEHPDKLVLELKELINEAIDETWANYKEYYKSKDDIKINLVCHSMGGLIARKYLIDSPDDHHVSKLIMIGTPNKGSAALEYEWVPLSLVFGGIFGSIAFNSPPLMFFTVSGIAWEEISRNMGVKLRSPATNAMKPNSQFLIDLNKRKIPADVEYIVVLCSVDNIFYGAINNFFGYKDGDGAVSFDSQSLKYAGIPNFKELNYKEIQIISPHAEEPSRVKDVIIGILEP